MDSCVVPLRRCDVDLLMPMRVIMVVAPAAQSYAKQRWKLPVIHDAVYTHQIEELAACALIYISAKQLLVLGW